ncbi:hypothetical protein SEA_ROSCOE_59 [Mycobacterium phage Roscoe]|uniref:Uncharacterized protein n=9 Tax=Pegunavirus TaxID=1623295 RepID=A0A2D1GA86_9CAUD|nr:hypothetical protein PBI_SOTO_57 [Mycobacterium phage Soto]YP_009191051.1 hypothetical protein AU159_gp057 [Mycobacterium phage Colbert]YP_009191152.1 hypothetical protein AU108_gp58 [Mycobacterium phage Eremos]AGC34014.1 hypothetical protein Nacho_0060 [Mycobacterium phage Nacho]AGK87437.1 hypothetical protein PBI_SDCHARGE11_58 [Mycobacterium phage SDcharge11]AHY84326.1 hypothetical protein PBI_KINGVEVEVE_57 [Mycobacterium phage KingVeVeVe]ATN88768.1 hypothetical protein SEA_DINGO_57 [Myc
MTENCQHYYGNDGSGWLTCVKCGATPPGDSREKQNIGTVRAGLPHLDPCVCTINDMTGAVTDYACGRALVAVPPP